MKLSYVGVPGSTLELVRELIAMRKRTPALQGHEPTTVVNEGYPFAWMRGEDHLVVVNPRREPALLETDETVGMRLLFGSGAHVTDSGVELDGFGYGIFAR